MDESNFMKKKGPNTKPTHYPLLDMQILMPLLATSAFANVYTTFNQKGNHEQRADKRYLTRD